MLVYELLPSRQSVSSAHVAIMADWRVAETLAPEHFPGPSQLSESLPGFRYAVLQKRPDTLSLCNPRRPFSGVAFCPLRYLAQPNPVLNGGPLDRNRKFGHWARRRGQVIGSELGHGKSDGFIKRIRLDLDSVRNSLCISERNAAAGYTHSGDYTRFFVFCSPSVKGESWRHQADECRPVRGNSLGA